MRICILIPTYRRNDSLARLLWQLADFRGRYRGVNDYTICITDSDHQNPKALQLEAIARYVRNPGTGFDENLLGVYLTQYQHYDYIFSISDGDLLPVGAVNPLSIIDTAVE